MGGGDAKRSLTRQSALHSQSHRQDRHQDFIGHWIYHRPNDCTLIPFSRYPAIQEISDTRVGEQTQRPSMMIMKDTVANERGGYESRCSQYVWYSVDVLMGGDRECLLQSV